MSIVFKIDIYNCCIQTSNLDLYPKLASDNRSPLYLIMEKWLYKNLGKKSSQHNVQKSYSSFDNTYSLNLLIMIYYVFI